MKCFAATDSRGFGLVELAVVIVVMGILVAVAMQSMTAVVRDARRSRTEQEMVMLADAIVGDASLRVDGTRSDFGYVGDIGSFPPNLRALYQNPGGYSTWNGPYIAPGFTQDTAGYSKDEWGAAYSYSGGVTITSSGSGTALSYKIADATSDYLSNTLNGTIRDAAGTPPGSLEKDSIALKITVPDGAGGLTMRSCSPDSTGFFSFDSLPVGLHPVDAIYAPASDTLSRYVTILPRHKGAVTYRFASPHFASGPAGGCSGVGVDTLIPMGVGSSTNLVASGCASNWECVADAPDYVAGNGSSFLRDEYETEDPADTACTITSVTVFFVARRMGTPASGGAVLRTHGSAYEPTSENLANSFTTYSYVWNVNPNTGSDWTWDEVRDMEIGVRLRRGPPGGNDPRCAQVWAEVAFSD